MNASHKSTFYYHACANPIGGHIRTPREHVLSAQGSAALAQAGGHASGQAGPHRTDGVVRFHSAYSEIYGTESATARGPVWTTTVSTVLEDLNVLDVIRADAIVAKLVVHHPGDGTQPSVSFAGTHFHNLTVEGKQLHPVLDLGAFARSEAEAAKSAAKPYEHEPRYLDAAKKHHGNMMVPKGAPSWLSKRYASLETPPAPGGEGVFLCSLVSSLSATAPHAGYGHVLVVPDVGQLFLGEIAVKSHMFRLTMLRLELGCAVAGEMSCASLSSNGSWNPGG